MGPAPAPGMSWVACWLLRVAWPDAAFHSHLALALALASALSPSGLNLASHMSTGLPLYTLTVTQWATTCMHVKGCMAGPSVRMAACGDGEAVEQPDISAWLYSLVCVICLTG